MIDFREVTHFHLFCGLGGGARGFNQGQARVGSLNARFRCLGGVDCDPAAIRDFGRLAGTPGTLLDLFDREQYCDFHGHEPPTDWREAAPEDLRRAAGNERPHIVFLSPPCKGFSGLLSEGKSKGRRYQALNRLALRGIWLMLEAWADDPPELVLLENVPRIATRGRPLLDQIVGLLRSYGYAVAETTHDCGELGGLAQSRRRFLLVARHVERVPPFLFQPSRRPLRAVGEVLERLPLPGQGGNPMHQLPSLQWRTWVRLAFVEAGSDWRSLARLAVQDGVLRDYAIVPAATWHDGALKVLRWEAPMGTVTGGSGPTTGAFSVADPRFHGREYGQYGVVAWTASLGAVSGQSAPGGGRYSVADPRVFGIRHNNVFRVVEWSKSAPSVTGGCGPTAGGIAVADPRPAAWRDGRNHYSTGGHYGVVPWTSPCGAVVGHAKLDRGPWSVADPRLPEATEQGVYVIRSLDGTWHRPLTTLELALLQGLLAPEDAQPLDGASHGAWRERIGNAVPPPAARAIAGAMGTTLLLAWSGETFALSCTPIWVRPLLASLEVAT